MLPKNGDLCFFDRSSWTFDDDSHDPQKLIKRSRRKGSFSWIKKRQLLPQLVHRLPLESLLDGIVIYLPVNLWQLLHYHELQKSTGKRILPKIIPLLDSHIRCPRQWSSEVHQIIFRLFWGFLFSRIGFKTLFLIAAIMNLTSFIVIMATNNNIAYLIFYTINSLSLGGLMVIFPNLTLIIFGKKIG